MATAALVHPVDAFHPGAYNPTYSSYPSADAPNIPSMIPPIGHRRVSGASDSHLRPSLPSLPSLKEMIGHERSSPYTTNKASSIPTPTTPSIPSPYTRSTHSHTLSNAPAKHLSPNHTHGPAHYTPRSEQPPPFTDLHRSSLSSRPPGPVGMPVRGNHGLQGPVQALEEAEATRRYDSGGYLLRHFPPGQLPLPAVSGPSDHDPSHSSHEVYHQKSYMADDYSGGGGRHRSIVNTDPEPQEYSEALHDVSFALLLKARLGAFVT
jgi:hypothetical protein